MPWLNVATYPGAVACAKPNWRGASVSKHLYVSCNNTQHRQELLKEPDFIANDIYEAAVWIMERQREEEMLW